jgi:hypothetical protein
MILSRSCRPLTTATLSRRSFSLTARRARALDMETVNTAARLQRLRELMRTHKVDVYGMPA